MKNILESYQIIKLLQYRYPFLLIDRVTEYEKGKRLKAVKAVSAGEPCFSGHFPDYPIMPGVLITEALAQSSSLMTVLDALDWKIGDGIPESQSDSMGVLGNVQISFLQSVLPGNLLELDVELDWKKGSASSIHVKASVEGNVCAKGKITVMTVNKNTMFS
ncbi:3-hydroxyacyl-[acyl-carrier-protein] dehydratase FabZ [Chryseobacterium phosphatilyticum]|uniref:3-hydroxyacyl-[acyl-carrier-protein] dehydratase FabZ n=1 Tax=Chryseobacterium phosphatilyticum TaxID=475075 RepID=A0A316XF10_9FLAO|nr:3-hydroxyacyl-ACP dehydratase FabZ [Chryseobacterium phosphatilyticum]PWN71789.1 3-hydroxyacyl-[acyl-carrier-protein] dehydratase FabZ [Chryseobacterium phosphatilyticum]